jgi:twitching motility protein PilU
MAGAESVSTAVREGMERLLRLLVQKNGSDLYLSANSLPVVRLHGLCVPASSKPLDPSDPAHVLGMLIGTERAQALRAPDSLQCVATLSGIGQFRVSAFFQRGTLALALRPIPLQVPHLEESRLAPALRDVAMAKSGLVLITGSAGAGKTSTVASLLDYRNRQTSGHILTLEQPIEYQLESKKSVVNQMAIGTDTADWASAFAGIAKQACDLVMVGEIHDAAGARAALQCAQSGMLCVAILNGASTGQALSRWVQFFPAADRPDAQNQLSQCLNAVVVQKLVRTKQGPRAALCEIFINGRTSTDMIARGAFSELDRTDIARYPGSLSFEEDAARLQSQGLAFENDDGPSSSGAVLPIWGASRFAASQGAGLGASRPSDRISQPITLSIKS